MTRRDDGARSRGLRLERLDVFDAGLESGCPRRLSEARRWVCWSIGAAIVLLFSVTASFGQTIAALEEQRPGVTEAQLERASSVLDLDETQREVASLLHDGYVRDVGVLLEQLAEVRRGALAEFRETGDRGVFRELLDVSRRFERARSELDREFLDELRLLLTEEQTTRWQRFQQDRRRMLELQRGGAVRGDSVDLVSIAEGLDLDASQRSIMEPLLDRYARVMDGVLREISAARDRVEEDFADAIAEADTRDIETALRAFEPILAEQVELGVRIREVNARFAEVAERSLPGDAGERFARAYGEAVYPRVYRRSTADRAIAAALAFDGVSEAQRERVAELRERYTVDRARLDRAWVEAIDAADESASVTERLMGGARSPEERDAREARRDLDARVVMQVRDALDEEVASLIPVPAGYDG